MLLGSSQNPQSSQVVRAGGLPREQVMPSKLPDILSVSKTIYIVDRTQGASCLLDH